MVYTILSSHNFFVPISSSRLSSKHLNSSFNSLPRFNNNNNKREIPLPSVASSSASLPYHPINLEYLRREFSGHGTTFEDIGEMCIAKLDLDNGSSATVMLPSGLITSYKVPVWHGGNVELLHTSVSQDEQDGRAVIRGGVSSAFCSESDSEGSWFSSNWTVQNITGNSEDHVQVELTRSDTSSMLELKQIITLREETLSCELIVSNTNSSSIQIKGSILSHLTVSTPEATYAVGLEGSNFVETSPFLPRFGIILDEKDESKSGFGEMLDRIVHKGNFPGFVGKSRRENDEEIECEEHSNYKQLNEEMSRIYTSAPQNFTVIDRGRRNSVVVGRKGFEELYMFSPGSRHDSYSKFAYVCIGQSALLNPITLKPGDVWRGVQHLHNPNS